MVIGHVFICYSALSFDAAVRIRKTQPAADEAYLLALFECPREEPGLFKGVFSISAPSHGAAELKKPFIIAAWFRSVLRRLRHLQSIVAYVPHPFELPANHFVYTDSRVCRLELLPDGLLNYTSGHFFPKRAQQHLRYQSRVNLRKLSAQLIGYRYQPLAPGHLTQFEQVDYKRCWTDNPQGYLSCRSELVLLPNRPQVPRRGELSSVAMVLDQELRPLVRDQLATRLRGALYQHLRKSGISRILYKGHPRGKNRTQELRSAGLQVEDVTGPELAEEIIAARPVTKLYGFYSTPLLLAAKQVEHRFCVLPAPQSRGVKNPAQVEEYARAFSLSGAQLLTVE